MSKTVPAYPCGTCRRPIRRPRVLSVRHTPSGAMVITHYCECTPDGSVMTKVKQHIVALQHLLGPSFSLPWFPATQPMPQQDIEAEVRMARWELSQVESADEFIELCRLAR